MLNNQQFLNVIRESFKTYLSIDTSRSNAKLKVLHGKIAKDIKSKASKKVLYNTKRYIGSNKTWKLRDKYYTSKDVAKQILKTCRDSMRRYNQGKEVDSVTITVPASSFLKITSGLLTATS